MRGMYIEFAELLASGLKHCIALLTVWLGQQALRLPNVV